MTNPGFHKWHYRATVSERATVLPDGCRDVLIVSRAGEADRVVQTEIDFHARAAVLPTGTEITGYRLRPGAVVSRDGFEGIAADPQQVEHILRHEVTALGEVDEAIEALATPGATVSSVSRALGVSIRTMQRQFLRLELPSPDFWRCLARARRAAKMLPSGAPLADIACDCGFSDQAHMTRDLTRWFGSTPMQLRRDAALEGLLAQPALGDWTGEHISMR